MPLRSLFVSAAMAFGFWFQPLGRASGSTREGQFMAVAPLPATRRVCTEGAQVLEGKIVEM